MLPASRSTPLRDRLRAVRDEIAWTRRGTFVDVCHLRALMREEALLAAQIEDLELEAFVADVRAVLMAPSYEECRS